MAHIAIFAKPISALRFKGLEFITSLIPTISVRDVNFIIPGQFRAPLYWAPSFFISDLFETRTSYKYGTHLKMS